MQPANKKVIVIRLSHGHSMVIRVDEQRLPTVLKELEEAKQGGKAVYYRDKNNAAPMTMIDGRCIVCWEVGDPNSGLLMPGGA